MTNSDFSPITALATTIEKLPIPWFVAGGYAIDLFLGRITREHHDIDCCAFRDTLPQLLEFFSDWERYIIEPTTKTPVPIDSALFPPLHRNTSCISEKLALRLSSFSSHERTIVSSFAEILESAFQSLILVDTQLHRL